MNKFILLLMVCILLTVSGHSVYYAPVQFQLDSRFKKIPCKEFSAKKCYKRIYKNKWKLYAIFNHINTENGLKSIDVLSGTERIIKSSPHNKLKKAYKILYRNIIIYRIDYTRQLGNKNWYIINFNFAYKNNGYTFDLKCPYNKNYKIHKELKYIIFRQARLFLKSLYFR